MLAHVGPPALLLQPSQVVAFLESLPVHVLVRNFGGGAGGDSWWALCPDPSGYGTALVVPSMEQAERLVTAVQLLTGRGLGATGVWRA